MHPLHPVVLIEPEDPGLVLNQRLNFAFLAILVYEVAITMDTEVARIWTLPWRLPKVLYFLNRYVNPAFLTCVECSFMSWECFLQICCRTPCGAYGDWQAIPPRLAMITAEVLVVIRVSAIYGHNKIILGILTFLLAGETVVIAVMVALGTANSFAVGAAGGRGCIIDTRPHHSPAEFKIYSSGTWIAPLVFEVVVIALTMYRVFLDYSPSSRILRTLARDSLVYFVCMFALSLANVIIYMTNHEHIPLGLLTGPSSAVGCIAVSRMMLNMREVLNDQGNCELSTFELAESPQHTEGSSARGDDSKVLAGV